MASFSLPVAAFAPTLTQNQIRVTTVSEAQYNDSKGGTIAITLPDPRTIPLQIAVYDGRGGTSYGQIPISNPAQAQTLTVSVDPKWKDGAVQTSVGYKFTETQQTAIWASNASSFRSEETSVDLGKKPFTWSVVDGIYKLGKPCSLGTIAGKTVTVTIAPCPPPEVPQRH